MPNDAIWNELAPICGGNVAEILYMQAWANKKSPHGFVRGEQHTEAIYAFSNYSIPGYKQKIEVFQTWSYYFSGTGDRGGQVRNPRWIFASSVFFC